MATAEVANEQSEVNDADSSRSITVASEVSSQNFSERGVWRRQFDFFVSCLGYSVGLGNFWRFPSLVFKNGGGVFLIPYLVVMILCTVPIVYLEMIVGQYSSSSTLKFGRVIPIFTGLGYGMFAVTLFTSTYYNVIIAWIIHFLFDSFAASPAFTRCDNLWNSNSCQIISEWNDTIDQNFSTTPSEEYLRYRVLDESSDILEFESINWRLALCLLAAWAIVFLSQLRGIHSTSRIIYGTVLVPWCLMLLFLIFLATIDGSDRGFRLFMSPDWSKITVAATWVDAASQAFFSLGPCFGSLLTLSSYNRFTYNIQRDAILIAAVDTLTSLLAGMVVFGSLGVLSVRTGRDISSIGASGSTLAFIACPNLISTLPVTPLWSILFFIMLLCLGFDSQLTMSESLVSSLFDVLPSRWQQRCGIRLVMSAGLCCFCFSLGLIMVTRSGIYWFELLNNFAANWNLLLLSVLFTLATIGCYGWRRVLLDVQFMLGLRPSIYWLFCWFISPVLLMAVLIYSWVTPESLTYGSYNFPDWCIAVGYCIALLPVACVLMGAAVFSIKFKCKWSSLSQPNTGPAGPALARAFLSLDCNLPDYIGGGDSTTDVMPNSQSAHSGEAIAVAEASSGSANAELKNADADEESSQSWRGKYDFFIVCLAYSIGFGSVWRFPSLSFRFGGGAFLVPYLLMLVLCGIPVYFLELILGQYFREGFVRVWRIIPLTSGIGTVALIMLIYLCVYYNSVASLCLYYLFASFSSELPWAHCRHEFSSSNCSTSILINVSSSNISSTNSSEFTNKTEVNLMVASDEYFRHGVLHSGRTGINIINWLLWLCCILLWIVTAAIICKGIRAASRIFGFLLLLGLLLLLVLLVFTLQDTRSLTGVKYFIRPNWSVLAQPRVWYEALVQVVYSLGIGVGCLVTVSSGNKLHTGCKKVAMSVAVIDFLASFFSGFVAFSFAGLLQDVQPDLQLEQIFSSASTDITLSAFPAAAAAAASSTAGRVAFAGWLICMPLLGISSISIVLYCACDAVLLPLRRCAKPVTLCCVTAALSVAAIFTSCAEGSRVIQLLDEYAIAWPVSLLCLLQLITVSWLFGVKQLIAIVKVMLGGNVSVWWRLCWSIVAPSLFALSLIFRWLEPQQQQQQQEQLPLWATVLGLILQFIPLLAIPICAFIAFIQAKGSVKLRLQWLIATDKSLFNNEEFTKEVFGSVMQEDLGNKVTQNRRVTYRRRVSIYGNELAIRQQASSTKMQISRLGRNSSERSRCESGAGAESEKRPQQLQASGGLKQMVIGQRRNVMPLVNIAAGIGGFVTDESAPKRMRQSSETATPLDRRSQSTQTVDVANCRRFSL